MKKEIPKTLKSKIVWRGNDRPAGLLLSEEESLELSRKDWEIADKHVAAELNEKLLLLAAWRGVDTSAPLWERKLCFILAADLYPGFQVVEKSIGRPEEWDYERKFKFMLDVERKRRALQSTRPNHVSAAHAISALVDACARSRKGDYLPEEGGSLKLKKTLKNYHSEFLNRAKHPHLALCFGHPDPSIREAVVSTFLDFVKHPEKD
jgi:hypothetical protein